LLLVSSQLERANQGQDLNSLLRLQNELSAFFSGDWVGNFEFSNGTKIEAAVNFTSELDNHWLVYRHLESSA